MIDPLALTFVTITLFFTFGYIKATNTKDKVKEYFFIGMWFSLLLLVVFRGLFIAIASRIIAP